MNLIGGIVGGMMGLFLLGPLGALVGSVLGSRISNSSVTRKNPNNFDHQLAFFAALFPNEFGSISPPFCLDPIVPAIPAI